MDRPTLITAATVVLILILVLTVVLIRQNKAGTYPRDKKVSSAAMRKGMGVGIAVGMGLGVSLGAAMDNMGTGIALGSGIGASMGLAMGAAFQKKEDEKRGRGKSREMPHRVVFPTVVALIILLTGFVVLGWFYFNKM